MVGSIMSLIAHWFERVTVKNLLLGNILGIIGLCFIFVSAFYLSDKDAFPGWDDILFHVSLALANTRFLSLLQTKPIH